VRDISGQDISAGSIRQRESERALGRVRKLGLLGMLLSTRNRGELTNTQWECLQPLLPPKTEHRPSRSQPSAHGEWHLVDSAHRRPLAGFARALWPLVHGGQPLLPVAQSRIGERIFAAVQAQADADGQIDWAGHDVDSTTVRAHQYAAGAKKGLRRSKR
jgi:transposase